MNDNEKKIDKYRCGSIVGYKDRGIAYDYPQIGMIIDIKNKLVCIKVPKTNQIFKYWDYSLLTYWNVLSY